MPFDNMNMMNLISITQLYSSILRINKSACFLLNYLLGDVVIGIIAVDVNWWHGEFSRNFGIFPLTHVIELVLSPSSPGGTLAIVPIEHAQPSSMHSSTTPDLSQEPCHSESVSNGDLPDSAPLPSSNAINKVLAKVRATLDLTAQLPEELSFATGDVIEVLRVVDEDFAVGRTADGSTGQFPVAFVEIVEGSIAVDEEQPQEERRLSKFDWWKDPVEEEKLAKRASQSYCVEQPSFDEQTAPIAAEEEYFLNTSHYFFSAAEQDNVADSQTATPSEVLEDQVNLSPVKKRDSASHVRAIFPFINENSNELTLVEGEIIRVLSSVDEQWMEGESADGRRGIFPSSYVEAIAFSGSVESVDRLGLESSVSQEMNVDRIDLIEVVEEDGPAENHFSGVVDRKQYEAVEHQLAVRKLEEGPDDQLSGDIVRVDILSAETMYVKDICSIDIQSTNSQSSSSCIAVSTNSADFCNQPTISISVSECTQEKMKPFHQKPAITKPKPTLKPKPLNGANANSDIKTKRLSTSLEMENKSGSCENVSLELDLCKDTSTDDEKVQSLLDHGHVQSVSFDKPVSFDNSEPALNRKVEIPGRPSQPAVELSTNNQPCRRDQADDEAVTSKEVIQQNEVVSSTSSLLMLDVSGGNDIVLRYKKDKTNGFELKPNVAPRPAPGKKSLASKKPSSTITTQIGSSRFYATLDAGGVSLSENASANSVLHKPPIRPPPLSTAAASTPPNSSPNQQRKRLGQSQFYISSSVDTVSSAAIELPKDAPVPAPRRPPSRPIARKILALDGQAIQTPLPLSSDDVRLTPCRSAPPRPATPKTTTNMTGMHDLSGSPEKEFRKFIMMIITHYLYRIFSCY